VSDVVPAVGRPEGLRLGGRLAYVWWGQDAYGQDRVAATAGRVYSFADEAGCRAAAEAHGWPADPDLVDEPATVTDFEPAYAWLSGRRSSLDPVAALNLWNWAGDIAASTGQPWRDRGGPREGCYTKLFAANVPWFYDRESYQPVWNARQLRTLRAVLGDAVCVLRRGCPERLGAARRGRSLA
jgi:hypothetical protein